MEEEEPLTQPTPTGGMEIVAYNLLALAFYTLLLKIAAGGTGFLVDGLIIVGHFIFCLAKANGKNKWLWVLSAFLVLIIGVSTCAMLGV